MKPDTYITMIFLATLVALAGLLGVAMLIDGIVNLFCWIF